MFDLDCLEGRWMLSAAHSVVPAHTLAYSAKAKQPPPPVIHATYSQAGSVLTVSNAQNINVADYGDGKITLSDHGTNVQDFYGVTDINVYGTDGDDQLSGGFKTANVNFYGGKGNDEYLVSKNGPVNVTVNDSLGTNDLWGHNNADGGSFVFNTNAQSTRTGTTTYPITVFRS